MRGRCKPVVAALTENLGRLETADRDGISAAEVPVLHELIDAQLQTLQRIDGSKKHGKES